MVTAAGSYAGNSVPEVYRRYGDVIDLYVFSAPRPGYPDGVQIALVSAEKLPALDGKGPWQVTTPIDLSQGQPARCLVAAQPTHDLETAGNRY